ncbi:MAG TPA: RidA family protein [Paraburkholderia sp.]|jgi:2-aminomuconate deaminase|nr:RidA family protein [Paraburkholderia sp.]
MAVAGKVAPLGNYPAVKCFGDLIYVSGISARLPDNSVAGVDQIGGQVKGNAAIQTQVILDKLKSLLEEHGSGLDKCLDVTAFLTDMGDFPAFNRVYAEHFQIETGPARTTIAVKALPKPGMVVELKVVAGRR